MVDTKRRSVIKLAGSAAAVASTGMAGILASGRTPAFAQQKTVHWLKWVDFVPATDALLKKEMMPEAEKALGIKINLETVNGNDLQPRITAGIQSGSGADLIMSFNSYTHLYSNSVVDLTDLAEDVGKREGGLFKYARAICSNGKMFMGMPWAVIGGMETYRKSWFEEVGVTSFPETWEAYREAGKKLKAKGRPLGQTLGHTFGDAPGFSYPFLWSWGGKEVEADGKTVVINSKETVESVKFMQGLWKDSMDEGGLAWDDTNNNRAFLSQTISATLNGASIYIEASRKPDQYQTAAGKPMNTDIQHAPLPKGPAGQFGFHLLQSNMLMKYSKNQDAAKEFLKWIHTEANYQVLRIAERLRYALHGEVGERQAVGRRSGDGAVQGRGTSRPGDRLRRTAQRQGPGRPVEVHHHRHVRQGGPGHAGRRGRQVGRERTEEDLLGLRSLTTS